MQLKSPQAFWSVATLYGVAGNTNYFSRNAPFSECLVFNSYGKLQFR